MNFKAISLSLAVALTTATAVYALTNRISIDRTDTQICVLSNGIPDHPTGRFPNAGNPHSISAQNVSVCVTATPEKSTKAQEVNVTGILKNGILVRPGTADWYDASSPRGHSRDDASGWNLDGMGPNNTLGLDENNAHVDHRGLYHYHGMPEALSPTSAHTQIGWAADGFPIHYVGTSAMPSYMLKSGTRNSAPFGAYDGSYNQDFEYQRGSGNLDKCNGALLDGNYVYFATDSYPYFPRCLYGTDITKIR
ncbi:YHYH protein [uncultured Litoreibacter sp.]|uniref:YHYH protein n=1 Tax=uncultured Litoreibacter sp. TaxID=1392394 RepID=UPI002611B3B4|nr:YHYH protein [uncultured Litoreibacter sp.]